MSPRKTKIFKNPAIHRVLFFALLAFAPAIAWSRPEPKYLGGRQPDQAEGARVLETFRHVGVQGDYWMRFELREMPHRGAERRIDGEMYGTQGKTGPLTHLVVSDPANSGGDRTVHYLLHGGAEARAWEWNAGSRGVSPSEMSAEDLIAPVQGTDFTIFDLQMPFLRWTDFVYEGVAKVRGRPAHAFILYPPRPLKAPANQQGIPVPSAIRVFLDTQFSAMTQAEWLRDDGKPMKTVTVLDLKKTGEQWIVKSIDLRNHSTRAKTRFAIVEAALDLKLPDKLFQPETISSPLPEIPAEKRSRF